MEHKFDRTRAVEAIRRDLAATIKNLQHCMEHAPTLSEEALDGLTQAAESYNIGSTGMKDATDEDIAKNTNVRVA